MDPADVAIRRSAGRTSPRRSRSRPPRGRRAFPLRGPDRRRPTSAALPPTADSIFRSMAVEEEPGQHDGRAIGQVAWARRRMITVPHAARGCSRRTEARAVRAPQVARGRDLRERLVAQRGIGESGPCGRDEEVREVGATERAARDLRDREPDDRIHAAVGSETAHSGASPERDPQEAPPRRRSCRPGAPTTGGSRHEAGGSRRLRTCRRSRTHRCDTWGCRCSTSFVDRDSSPARSRWSRRSGPW